jgi:glycoside/pentoside/hexuronide:cation symporter, GPH family
MTVVGKMIADVSDEHEPNTGARQEGLLLLSKAASGIGTLISGIIIKVCHFPDKTSLETMDPAVVSNLGLGTAIGSICFGLLTFFFYSRFQLSHEQHAAIVQKLRRRRPLSDPQLDEPVLAGSTAS